MIHNHYHCRTVLILDEESRPSHIRKHSRASTATVQAQQSQDADRSHKRHHQQHHTSTTIIRQSSKWQTQSTLHRVIDSSDEFRHPGPPRDENSIGLPKAPIAHPNTELKQTEAPSLPEGLLNQQPAPTGPTPPEASPHRNPEQMSRLRHVCLVHPHSNFAEPRFAFDDRSRPGSPELLREFGES